MRWSFRAILIAGLVGLASASAAQEVSAIGEPIPPYLVMFESDEGDLTSLSRLVLDQVAVDFQAGGIQRLEVRGHYDRTGTAQHRIDVSRLYAEAVRDYLLNAGIPTDAMFVTWAGDSESAIPTADDTAEASNRRVEVIVPEWMLSE